MSILLQAALGVSLSKSVAALAASVVVIGAALGISRIASAALESIARQPEAAGDIRSSMILAAALIEGVAMFAILASNFEGILADTYNMEEYIQAMSTFLAMLVSFGIFCLISIYLFVMMVLPSKPGSNKYGPSTLFPKA